MEICLYMPVVEGFAAALEGVVGEVVPRGDLTVLRAFPELRAAMGSFFEKGCVFILHAPDSASLETILTIKDRVLQHKIILITADNLPATISSGHLLRPRLQVSEGEEALEIIPAVLQKMMKRGKAVSHVEN